MITRLLSRWRASREARVLERRAIPDAMWDATLERFAFLGRLNPADQAELRRLSTLFLDQKQFSGAQGLSITDEMAVAVAAQACLPVLRLGLGLYDGFVGIVMHHDEVTVRREVMDEAGVVHEYDETLSGEAVAGGPVMLSWNDVAMAGAEDNGNYNVVIHEFAHVIDMADGVADGVPPLPDAASQRAWHDTLMVEFDTFSSRVVCGYDTVVDPYGAEAPAEFFAVATEAFFVTPEALKAEQPVMYRLLSSYFKQNPA